ncbi:hypothetical protein M427DRAFT_55043 [Gonapodya prolifera JEL478]|uniref:Uncharacterized protein n=1 Tax=Gonapodya prolifera (strain JEL478) TaxID=1344416 RepID=A0A139AKI9_GONPJ|nr:hypothetical protein M427DRAFT_55043 [Gonapodya prolifera JEL478]|eukprot:KXS17023.1 hypothetical protein M427DRAFT_55043 [Gonapodya prolifera JEL478]
MKHSFSASGLTEKESDGTLTPEEQNFDPRRWSEIPMLPPSARLAPSRRPSARVSVGDHIGLPSVTAVSHKISNAAAKVDRVFDEFTEGAEGRAHPNQTKGVAIWPEGRGKPKFPNGHYLYRPFHLCTLRRPFCEVIGDDDMEQDILSPQLNQHSGTMLEKRDILDVAQQLQLHLLIKTQCKSSTAWILGAIMFHVGLGLTFFTHTSNFITFLQIQEGKSNWYTDGWNDITANVTPEVRQKLFTSFGYAGSVVFGADSVIFFIVLMIFVGAVLTCFWLFWVEYQFVRVLERDNLEHVAIVDFFADSGPAGTNLSQREKRKRKYRYIRRRRQLAVYNVVRAFEWLRYGSSLSLLSFLNFDYSYRTASYLMTRWMEWLTNRRQELLEMGDPGVDPETPGAALQQEREQEYFMFQGAMQHDTPIHTLLLRQILTVIEAAFSLGGSDPMTHFLDQEQDFEEYKQAVTIGTNVVYWGFVMPIIVGLGGFAFYAKLVQIAPQFIHPIDQWFTDIRDGKYSFILNFLTLMWTVASLAGTNYVWEYLGMTYGHHAQILPDDMFLNVWDQHGLWTAVLYHLNSTNMTIFKWFLNFGRDPKVRDYLREMGLSEEETKKIMDAWFDDSEELGKAYQLGKKGSMRGAKKSESGEEWLLPPIRGTTPLWKMFQSERTNRPPSKLGRAQSKLGRSGSKLGPRRTPVAV